MVVTGCVCGNCDWMRMGEQACGIYNGPAVVGRGPPTRERDPETHPEGPETAPPPSLPLCGATVKAPNRWLCGGSGGHQLGHRRLAGRVTG